MLPTHVLPPEKRSAVSDMGMQSLSPSTYPPSQSVPSNGQSTSNFASTPIKRRRYCGEITALTVQTQTPYEADGSNIAIGTQRKANRFETHPSRWHTLEFKFYALVFLAIVPVMCWTPIRLSLGTSPNYHLYSRYLTQGWLFGRDRDDSDFQYRSFRDYVPVLTSVMLVYLGLSSIAGQVRQPLWNGQNETRTPRPNRVMFLSVFTVIFVVVLHGFNVFKLLAISAANYGLTTTLGSSRISTFVIWAFNVLTLFAVHYYDGFQYGDIAESLRWMDDWTGLLPRWQINFNISMLRLVSFALDYHWSQLKKENQHSNSRGPIADARERADTPVDGSDYNMLLYLLYIFYPPLFIAGPIVSFNDFTHQLRNPLPIEKKYTLLYAVRLAFCMLSMEFVLHFMYVNAIKDAKAWGGASPMELSMIGFWNLIVVWLKLLIPWRFFRLWALADGVDAPENMVRCMANNYSTLGFWRSWHRSYNLWIVRYIYVPVGGAKNAIPATLLVFTFVALWHDLSLKLLTWGWLVTLFILPEVAGRSIISSKKYGENWWYRHVCAAGGVFNVLLMMTANLVGFAIGTDGMAYMWQQLLNSWSGLQFMVAACATLFVGVQVMFEYREEELRRGINRKC